MNRRTRVVLIAVPVAAVLIGAAVWQAWRVAHRAPPVAAIVVVNATAASASLTAPEALRTIGALLGSQGVAVGPPGSVVLLGSPSAPNIRAVFTLIEQRRPARLYLIGLSRHQQSTLYFHTRSDRLSVFVNPQSGTIAGPADLASAVRNTRNYAPQGRRHRTGGQASPSGIAEAAREEPSGLPAPPALASIDLSRVPQVGDQGDENSCTGWSVGYYYETFQVARQRRWSASDPRHQFSPSFVYNQINAGKDQSAAFTDAFHILKDQGDVPLTEFPYRAGDYLTQPDPDVVLAAGPFQISSFRHLYYNMNALQRHKLDLARLKRWLATGDGFVFAMNLPKSFNNANGGVYDDLSKPTSDTHCMFAVGYDDNVNRSGIGAFRVVNSWGKDWGDLGYLWISYAVFEKDTNEVWTMHAANQ